MSTPRTKIPVAVLGATGAVGQKFVRFLSNHPWFTLAQVAASERSAGKTYAEAANWIDGQMPESVAGMTVTTCDPKSVEAPIVFSALDAAIANDLEPAFARAGSVVLSNAKSHRMAPDVPLVVPDVNCSHLDLLAGQRRAQGWSGGIVTNSNCAVAVAVMPLAPLHRAFGVTKVFAMTMQAISGAGYPGVPSLDIIGNVIPFIGDEEPKIETEACKILGVASADRIAHAPIAVSAHANRVHVKHGHTVCMSIALEKKASPDEALAVLREWKGDPYVRQMPTAPATPLIVRDEPNRPQPARDVDAGNGMSAIVGRVRPDPILDLRLVALGHNVVLGAAGASVLNAELLVSKGLVPGV